MGAKSGALILDAISLLAARFVVYLPARDFGECVLGQPLNYTTKTPAMGKRQAACLAINHLLGFLSYRD